MLIHVIADNEEVCSSLVLLLRSVGHKARAFDCAAAFSEEFDQGAPDCLILDLSMSVVNGAELLELLRQRGCGSPAIFCTAQPDSPLAGRARAAGGTAILSKPLAPAILLDMLHRIAVRQQLEPSPRRERGPGIYQVGLADERLHGLATLAEKFGWPLVSFDSADDCLDAMDRDRPDCIVCDIDVPQGASLARVLLAQYCEVPGIALGHDTGSTLSRQLTGLGGLDRSWTLLSQLGGAAMQQALARALCSWLGRPPRRLYAAVSGLPPAGDPDFLPMLDIEKTRDLVLNPELRITAVSGAYAESTMLSREDHIGSFIFDVFPDNPADPAASGVFRLNASLRRTLKRRWPDQMRLQRYDVRGENGGGAFEERWWYPINYPVMRDGVVDCLVHRVEDVTRFVRLRRATSAQHPVDRLV